MQTYIYLKNNVRLLKQVGVGREIARLRNLALEEWKLDLLAQNGLELPQPL